MYILHTESMTCTFCGLVCTVCSGLPPICLTNSGSSGDIYWWRIIQTLAMRQLSCLCNRLQWLSQPTWWESPAKRWQIILLKMYVKNVFQLVKPFLANLHPILVSNNTHICTLWPLFAYEYQKYAEFYDYFKLEIIGKMHPVNVICQNLLLANSIRKRMSSICCYGYYFANKLWTMMSIEEDKLQMCALFLP